MIEIKVLRRTIIVICLIILGLNIYTNSQVSKYYYDDIKKLVEENKAVVIEVNKSIPLDKDKIVINRIIRTSEKTYIRYTINKRENGWSFPFQAIKIYDDKNHLIQYSAMGSSSRFLREDGIVECKALPENAKYLVMRLEWFDRKGELRVSLGKEGVMNENK